LGVAFERCEDKGEKSVPKFVPSSNYHKEEKTLKSTKTHYPSNPKPSFKPKREERKETPKTIEKAFICMFCGRAGHLDEFCFDYARNSNREKFIDFLPHTSSCASPHFFHGPNHHYYGFGSQENSLVPRYFGHGPCPHRGDRSPCRHGFPARDAYYHFESSRFDGPCFPHCGSHPTRLNGEV
jgi:hypothetical protein